MRLLLTLGALLTALLWAAPTQAEEDYTELDPYNTWLIACVSLESLEMRFFTLICKRL